MPKRIALIIANKARQAKQLSQLSPPEADVRELASVLRDPEIGFESFFRDGRTFFLLYALLYWVLD